MFVFTIIYFYALGMLTHCWIIGRRKMPITNLSSTRNGKAGCHEMTITNLDPITDRSSRGSETLALLEGLWQKIENLICFNLIFFSLNLLPLDGFETMTKRGLHSNFKIGLNWRRVKFQQLWIVPYMKIAPLPDDIDHNLAKLPPLYAFARSGWQRHSSGKVALLWSIVAFVRPHKGLCPRGIRPDLTEINGPFHLPFYTRRLGHFAKVINSRSGIIWEWMQKRQNVLAAFRL